MKVLVVTVTGRGVDLNDINDTLGIWNHLGIQKIDLVIAFSKK